MDNAADDRNESLPTKNPSDEPTHIPDEQLLFALDGELSPSESAHVKVHLESCWSCRARSERIEETIANVVEYRDFLTSAPLSGGERAMFVARLQQLARSIGKPSLRSRIVGTLRAMQVFAQGAFPRQVGISALVVAILALLLATRPWEVRKVSANQLLENAQVSEVRAIHTVMRPVLYQKLRIRIGNEAVTRTIYRDLGGKRQTDRMDVSGSNDEPSSSVHSPRQIENRLSATQNAKTEIEQTFVQARLNWQDPLSPSTYRDWHNQLEDKQDQVSVTGNNLVTLTTTTNEGPVAEARLTFRTSDFHPIAAILLLHDTRRVEVTELVWDVLPLEAVDPTIFATEPARTPDIVRSTNLVPSPSPVTDAELAESELQARVAIHAEEADLGEQIELERDQSSSRPGSGGRSVVVRGIVSTPERKNSLLAALQGISHVELRLQTVEEATAQQKELAAEKSSGFEPQIPQGIPVRGDRAASGGAEIRPAESSAVAVVGRRALEQQLGEQYPKAEDRAAFINRAVEIVQEASAQAWALRRLRDRYEPQSVAELSRGSRQTLELLIRDHVSVLRQHVDEARAMIATLLSPESSAKLPALSTLDAPISASSSVRDWRYTVTEIFPEVQEVHEDVAALLAESGRTTAEGQALVHDLQVALAKLQAQLPVLYQDVSGPFLSGS